MDDALVASIVHHNVYPNANIAGEQRATNASLPPWLEESDPMMKLLRESVPPEVIQRMIDSFKNRDPKRLADARDRYDLLAPNVPKLNPAGAPTMLGADTVPLDKLSC